MNWEENDDKNNGKRAAHARTISEVQKRSRPAENNKDEKRGEKKARMKKQFLIEKGHKENCRGAISITDDIGSS